MSNPLGQADIVGNWVTANDLLNSASTTGPVAAVGSGLPSTYVAGAVVLTGAATSNTFEVPYSENLFVLVSLVSGTASAMLNTGSTSSNLTQQAITYCTATQPGWMLVELPSASIGSTSPNPGQPTTPFFNVSFATAGCQIKQLAVLDVGYLVLNADDSVSVRAGKNAYASGVTNTFDTLNPPDNLVGSGIFSITA